MAIVNLSYHRHQWLAGILYQRQANQLSWRNIFSWRRPGGIARRRRGWRRGWRGAAGVMAGGWLAA